VRKIADLLAGFQALPETDIATLLQGSRPLILAPHPDDESLGCGGLIAAATAIGLAPSVIILTDGSASHPGSIAFPPAKLAALRETEALRAVTRLGLPAQNLHFLRYADTKLPRHGPGFDAALAQILAIGRAQHCGLVIGPWHADPHCDHEAAATLAAMAAQRADWPLFSYPVWGWLRGADEWVAEPRDAGWRLDISAQQSRKQRAIAAHQSQYGRLITDSPDGFRLPENLLAVFARPFEVFIA
jgi:LmbE family N-acetylglucosaminyl deacetylase